jgi:peptide deformylase
MILTDEKALRVECTDVLPEEVDDIRKKLEYELEESGKRGSPGIGLAAPQIGIPKRMAIIRLDKYKIDLVNATIHKSYDLSLFEGEGCLSFPGRTETTKRYNEIHIIDNMVAPEKFIAKGLLAVVIQHELDHTQGILLPDFAIKKVKKSQKSKIRPNDKCPCLSGKKAKRCCY